jgi:ABC-type branched-subunit amino acid transport system permease subunit
VLVGVSNQVSLCQFAFAAVGAAAFGHFLTGSHLPWLLALGLSGLVAVPIGAFVAIPAIRLSGIYLALATFGFGLLVQLLVYPTSLMFGTNALIDVPRPLGASGQRAFYFVVAGVVVFACAVVWAVSRARLGRYLRAMGDSPLGLASLGTSVNSARVLVFCISAFLAAVSGALLGAGPGVINGTAFSPFDSLIVLAVLAICGRGLIVPSFIAAIAYVVIPSYLPASVANYLTVGFGVAAVMVALRANSPPLTDALLAGGKRSRERDSRTPVRERLRPRSQVPATGAL